MTVIDTARTTRIEWEGGGLALAFEHDEDGPVRLVAVDGPDGGTAARPGTDAGRDDRSTPRQPLVEVLSPPGAA
ncbi:hypothetical protein CMsap09_01525 [Clavibacter michiganensis]|uniref:Uncharacterized protein n=1 Tax=Clavibacter michiganensis TaxID=28447 RepID=A0A251XQN9_9MICO|nr:hypothetical protein CMsap09_01525 [Clavibacter michiganensis]